MNIQVPPNFTDVIGFGVARKVYGITKSTKWINIGLAIFFLLATLVWGVYLVAQVVDEVSLNGLIGLRNISTLYILGLGLCAFIGLGCAWNVYDNWHKLVVVYDSGFACQDRKGLKTLRWEEVDTITAQVMKHYTQGVFTGTTHQYTIVKMDHDNLKLDDRIANVEELAGIIRAKVFPFLLQRHQTLFQAAVPLKFGQVTISRVEGLRVGNKHFAWDEITTIQLKEGEIQIKRKGGGLLSGARIQTATTPNVDVLLALIDTIVGVKRLS